jgi:tRNA (guanine10-N2)-dimethyltransferase
VAKLFFLLSGEHENLPISELKAILEAESYNYKVLEKLDQVLRLEADKDCVESLKRRAALTRICAQELFTSEADIDNILSAARAMRWDEVIGEDQSFVVRVRHVKNYGPEIDGMILERRLGELVLDKVEARVKLRNPDKTFIGILTEKKFIFGLKLAEIPAKPFVERRPRKRPFFHPSAMQAKLARCMVNLAEPKTGALVLDPFCGTGTMLIEAALVGCRGVGMDIQRRMAKGTVRNLGHFKIEPEGVVVADAQALPLTRVDCVVTDPPYGISSTTLKRGTTQIVEEVLRSVYGLLDEGQRICLAAPKKLNIVSLGTALGYKHLESHFVYVHRSLTREIVVLEKE